MPWFQIRFPAVREQAQQLSDALEECGALSVSIEHVGGDAWVETDWNEAPVWQQSRVIALFPEHTDLDIVLDQLKALTGTEPPAPTTELLADEDWESSWKENYRPLRISERLWICPSWIAPPDSKAVNVILDPGMAFGTGDHPTTALCLEWLAEQNLDNRDVIDYGCGSGILSIAALKLGARAMSLRIGLNRRHDAFTVGLLGNRGGWVSSLTKLYPGMAPGHNLFWTGVKSDLP